MAAASEPTAKKRRRIQPIAVRDDDAPTATLPAATLAADPSQAPQRDVPPPEPGRRIEISLKDGYDFNYKKMLSQRGIKMADRRKQKQQDAPSAMPGAPVDLVDALGADKGNNMQQTIAAIQERIQRESLLAATGRVDDSDEEEADVEVEGDEEGGDDDDGEEADGDDDGKGGDDDVGDGDIVDKAARNAYDNLDPFIDDSEFIEAVEKRDARQTKHTGFFVNVGAVERIGEKPPAKQPRKRKAPDAEAAAVAAAPAAQAAAPSAVPSGANAAAAPNPPAKVARIALPPVQAPAAAPAAPAMSMAQMAMAAAAQGAAAGLQPRPPAVPAAVPSAAPAAALASASPGSARPVLNSPVALVKPPGQSAASTPATTPHAVRSSDGAAAAPIDMNAHYLRMMSLPSALSPEQEKALGWNVSPKLRRLLEKLREVCARTVPNDPGTKRKTPDEIMTALDAVVRPFYIESENGPNMNKVKRAVWQLLFPILAPWVAETTVKSKMQNANARMVGAYGIAKTEFCNVAKETTAHDDLNNDRVAEAVGNFINKLAEHEAEDPESPDAEQPVWVAAQQVWEQAGGCPLNTDVLKRLYKRAPGP